MVGFHFPGPLLYKYEAQFFIWKYLKHLELSTALHGSGRKKSWWELTAKKLSLG
jgi:hypothetical protein